MQLGPGRAVHAAVIAGAPAFLLLLLLLPQGLSITGAAMATMEMARVDASCATYYLVHTFLAMLTVSLMVRVRALDSSTDRDSRA
jgi:hypothetical protein